MVPFTPSSRAVRVPSLHRCLLKAFCVSCSWLGAVLWGDQHGIPFKDLTFQKRETLAQKNIVISDSNKCDEENYFFYLFFFFLFF